MNKFKKALDCVRQCNCIGCTCDSINVLQELVDRATPKKPEEKKLIRKDNYRDGTNIPRYDWWCPNCHLEHMGTNIIKFCPTCGQALDWSDEK